MALALVRTIVLCASNLLALLVLGFSAYSLSQIIQNTRFPRLPSVYTTPGVTTSILHLCSVTPMIIIGLLRDGACTSYLAFEFSWLTFLWIMWLAIGAYTVAELDGVVSCTDTFCYATQVIAAVSFFIWPMLFGYTITLLTFAIKAAKAGQNVWVTDVKQVRWVQGPTNVEKPVLGTPHGTPHLTLATTDSLGMASPAAPHPQCPHPQCLHPQCPHQQGIIYV